MPIRGDLSNAAIQRLEGMLDGAAVRLRDAGIPDSGLFQARLQSMGAGLRCVAS